MQPTATHNVVTAVSKSGATFRDLVRVESTLDTVRRMTADGYTGIEVFRVW